MAADASATTIGVEVTPMSKQRTQAAPRIVERPTERMAVLESVGDPAVVGSRAAGALYGAIAQLGLSSGALRSRWPNAPTSPREQWVARWALPVPDHTPELGGGIVLETWYGRPAAEVLYERAAGNGEREAVKRLHRFIADCGYEVAGPAEEEYLTTPGEEPARTIIRYEIRQML
jgi:hypothetical protein